MHLSRIVSSIDFLSNCRLIAFLVMEQRDLLLSRYLRLLYFRRMTRLMIAAGQIQQGRLVNNFSRFH